MKLLINHFLDYFFVIFHTCLILFNVLGWLFKKTRFWNLCTLLATFFSWFILGFFYGFGYCFCTDWHWMVRAQLGYQDPSRSYIHFLLLNLTGINFNEDHVIFASMAVFFCVLFLSLLLNGRDFYKKLKAKRKF